MLSRDFLDVLACPVCKGKIEEVENKKLLCLSCYRAYPIMDGIPVMLEEEAEQLTEDKAKELLGA
jgi:uncharacterized protein YbaR (Trm112 family)